jgi:uncharacterized OB-fold protein
MAEQGEATADTGVRPIVPYLKLAPQPHLIGSKCSCGAVFVTTKRLACSKCGSTGPFDQIQLSTQGKVYVFSVVHQSFPGIPTPYITAVIDLPEGASVRSNLVDYDPAAAEKEPHKVFDLPVEMTTYVSSKDREGHDVVAFAFRPIRR